MAADSIQDHPLLHHRSPRSCPGAEYRVAGIQYPLRGEASPLLRLCGDIPRGSAWTGAFLLHNGIDATAVPLCRILLCDDFHSDEWYLYSHREYAVMGTAIQLG